MEIASVWWLARSPTRSERPSTTIVNTASRVSTAVSFGRRLPKRMHLSSATVAPATIDSPRTSSAFANSEPRIDVCATTVSPDESANRTTNNSGRFPSVDCNTPVTAGPKWDPIDSVPIATIQASPPRASAQTRKVATCSSVVYRSTPAIAATPNVTAIRTARFIARSGPGEAHALVHRLERRRRRLGRLLGADAKQPLELARVGDELFVPKPHRLEQFHDRLGHVRLELPVALPVVAVLDLLRRGSRRDGHDVDEVRDARLVGRAADFPAGVSDGDLELPADHVRRIDHQHRAHRRSAGRRHLRLGLLEIHDPCADLRVLPVGELERLSETLVEARGDVAGQLEVLALVVADRNEVGLVQEDVAGHQHRVREQARRDELLLVRLVLELGHPAQLAEARDRAQQARRLRVRLDVALDERRRALGVETGREQHRSQVDRGRAQLVGVVVDGDRVEVDDAEEALAELLRGRVLPETADVVA